MLYIGTTFTRSVMQPKFCTQTRLISCTVSYETYGFFFDFLGLRNSDILAAAFAIYNFMQINISQIVLVLRDIVQK